MPSDQADLSATKEAQAWRTAQVTNVEGHMMTKTARTARQLTRVFVFSAVRGFAAALASGAITLLVWWITQH